MTKIIVVLSLCLGMVAGRPGVALAQRKNREQVRAEKKEKELRVLQERFKWWPTDAKPGIVKDPEGGGYWWWPKEPGEIRPWGNRGYVYVYKIIYDYKAEEEEGPEAVQQVDPEPAPEKIETVAPYPELKPSLLIKKIIKNVKIYFDYNKASLREDHLPVLNQAVKSLQRNPDARILITGNCDRRGSTEYNERLGKKRGQTVKEFMLGKGIPEGRILIVTRGKLDAVAPVTDLVGMQKDRNAQFMIAEVEEIMIPEMSPEEKRTVRQVSEGKYVMEQEQNVETAVKVSTREYVVQTGDSLSKIAQKEMGGGHRWKYLYELNKDRIADPNKLRVGQIIVIPVE